MRRFAVSLLALLGSVLAAATALLFWVVWERHQAPLSILLDIAALALVGFVAAAVAHSPRCSRPGPEILSSSALDVSAPVWTPRLPLVLWATCGGLLGVVAMGSLAVAPWLLIASLLFAAAALQASRGVRWRGVRGVAVVLIAAPLNGIGLWLLLLSAYSPAPPEAFRARDFYANELLADVPVHDMWIVALEGGGEGRTVEDVQAVMATVSPWEANPSVVALVMMRGLLGWAFDWDEEVAEEAELSYLRRVSDEVLARSLEEPGRKGGYFQLMYTLENETVAEILNRTAHAFFCMAIEPSDDGYTLYWVILVKEEMPLTPFYMGLIDPFRRYLVHRSMVRSVEQRWRHRYSSAHLDRANGS